jgi:hypothetical protein
MPVGKPSQSNAMLYTLITFVVLFLIAGTCAVIFYIKSEDYRTQKEQMDNEMSRIASAREQGSLNKIIGNPAKGKSLLGTMNDYLDEMVLAVAGQVPQDTSAEVKINEVKIKINDVIQSLGQDAMATYGSEEFSLLQTMEQLKANLEAERQVVLNLENQLNTLQDDFDTAAQVNRDKEDQMIEKINYYLSEAERIQSEYDELKQLMTQSADEQIRIYADKLKQAEQTIAQKDNQLAQLKDEFDNINNQLQSAMDKIEAIKPRPDIEVLAFKPDARIVNIDLQTNLVYLDIGSDDHVYRGLTFSVYDKSAQIPEDGRGKAEIEVFQVEKEICAARINISSKKNPIVPDDIVANLIWDTKTSNKFVVIGEFDFDGDGKIDSDGQTKIRRLIERWGGTIVENASIDTDFIVRGTTPQVLSKPTSDQIALDPLAQQRYEQSLEQAEQYDAIFESAEIFRVPVFNQKRFMNLIGYKALASKSTPL